MLARQVSCGRNFVPVAGQLGRDGPTSRCAGLSIQIGSRAFNCKHSTVHRDTDQSEAAGSPVRRCGGGRGSAAARSRADRREAQPPRLAGSVSRLLFQNFGS